MSDQSSIPLDENADIERSRNARREVAIGLFQREDGRVLLMRTKRLPGSWQPIGGGVRAHDRDPVATIVREAREELGVSIDPELFRHVTDLPYDFGEGTIHCYTGQWSSDLPEITVDESEVAEAGWFTLEDAVVLPAFPATKALLKLITDESP